MEAMGGIGKLAEVVVKPFAHFRVVGSMHRHIDLLLSPDVVEPVDVRVPGE